MNITIDDKGYLYAPFLQSKVLLAAKVHKHGFQGDFKGHVAMKGLKEIAEAYNTDSFHQYAISFRHEHNDVNRLLMEYHLYRFLKNGSITYKFRPKMIDFLETIKMDIPAHLFQPPFREFMISIPKGYIEHEGHSLLNIYVAEEPVDLESFKSSSDGYEVDKGLAKIVLENQDKIKRVIRVYGISYGDNLDVLQGRTMFYQLPLIEDQGVTEQYEYVQSQGVYPETEFRKKMFEIVLKFVALLNMKGFHDIRREQGTIRDPKYSDDKKLRAAERHNEASGYNFFDVGYLHEANNRVEYDTVGTGNVMTKTFRVRRHLRAQWYGPKTESKPGDHQEIIMIEEFKKGSGEERPKITIV